jgi:hypothetical protein
VILINPTAKGSELLLLGCIGEALCVGGSCHCRFAIFVVLVVPYRGGMTLKFLRAKKEAQEALFADEIN